LSPNVGGRYEFGSDAGPATIVELDPDKVLAYTWRNPDTTVRWSLRSSRGSTYLTLVHSGFADDALAEQSRLEWLTRLVEVKRVLELGEGKEPELADDFTRDRRGFTVLVRNLCFSLLRALADRDYESFLDLVEPGDATLAVADVERALRPLFDTGETIRLDAVARNPEHTTLEPGDEYWRVHQSILVGDDISEFTLTGRIDLARSRAQRRPVLLLDHVGAL